MVEARKDDDERPVADNATADLSRLAGASSRLFAEQAAAFAVMTAYGMNVAAQMTGMMMGALRGPVEADAAVETQPVEQKPPATVVPLRPRSETVAAPVSDVAAKPLPKLRAPVRAKISPAAPPALAPARSMKSKAATPTSSDRDDLKKLSGIGPRLEQALNERGIKHYADVAKMSKAALKKLDVELGLEGRVLKDDWAGQAKILSGGKA